MIREGYLLHNGRARLFAQDDADLALLTGTTCTRLGWSRSAARATLTR